MKIECRIEDLKKCVQSIDRITSTNITLPILETILISVTKKQCIIRATNMQLGVEIEVPVKVEAEGIVAIKSSILNSFLSNQTQSGFITLELEQDNLLISTNTSNARINVLPAEDFPTLPHITDGEYITIPREIFTVGIPSVVYSASVSEIRPEMSSVYIYQNDGNVNLVATDGFRLAEKKIPTTVNIPTLLIPHKNAIEISKILSGSNNTVEIKATKTQLVITDVVAGVYITSRIIDGVFPDYKQIIPKEHKTDVVILKNDIVNAVKTSNIFTDKFNHIILSVDLITKTIVISSKSNEVGIFTSSIPATINGESIEMSINYRYLTDCLNVIQDESIRFSFTVKEKPMVIQPLHDLNFLYLIMPLNR